MFHEHILPFLWHNKGIGKIDHNLNFWGTLLMVSSGFLFSMFLVVLIYPTAGLIVWGIALLSLVLWFTILGLWFLIVRNNLYGYGVLIAIGALSLVFSVVNIWAVIGSIAFALFLVFAYRSARNEENLLQKIKVFRVIRRSIPKVVTGLIILFAILYGTTAAADIFRNSDTELVPKKVVEWAFIPVGFMVKSFVPDYTEQTSIEEIVPWIDSQQYETLTAFAHRTINEYVSSIIEPYRTVAPLFFIVGIFLVLKALSIPIIWLMMGIIWFFARLLLRFKILEVRLEVVNKERLVFRR